MKALLRATLLLLGSWIPFSSASPLESSSYNNIVYFADSDSNTVERYSLASEAYLTPITLNQNPLAIHVDASGIYVSYAVQIVKLALDGSGEAAYQAVDRSITDIESTDQYLVLAGHSYLQITNKANGALVDSLGTSMIGSSISLDKDGRAIYFGELGWSLSPMYRILLGIDGMLDNRFQSTPYLSGYVIGDHAQEFPTLNLVVDKSGNVYHAMSLEHAGDLGGEYSAIAFWQGQPLVLRENKVYSYNAWFQQTGVYQLGLSGATDVFVYQDKVFAFARVDASTPTVQVFDVDLTTPADPTDALDPANLQYKPDSFALDVDKDTLYLFNKTQRSIFRWSLSQGTYLESIPLINAPDLFTYSPKDQRIYLSYYDRNITYIDLVTKEEKPFVNVESRLLAMIAADDFLIVKDNKENSGTLSSYNNHGEILDSQNGFERGHQLVWNEKTRTVHFIGQFNLPLRIILDSEGRFGDAQFSHSIVHDDWVLPLRVSELGKYIAAASGRIVDGVTKMEVADIESRSMFSDLTWMHGNLFTLEGIEANTVSQLVRWRADFSPDIDSINDISGEPVGLIPIAEMDKLLVIIRLNGKPAFELISFLEEDFDSDGTSDSNDLFSADATETLDFDQDGIGDNTDTDNDNDGVADAMDAFPRDPLEALDTDGDNRGNNADTDDDNDGVLDANDRFPLDASESDDLDNDGIGDNADPDIDGDSTPNDEDAFPYDPIEWADADGDSIGDMADNDDDNDSVNDEFDWFPLNSDESSDMDYDGIGDNADPDRDGDFIVNALDKFPNDRDEWLDTDSDDIGNNADTDDDGDGVADSIDRFPLNSQESSDMDNDNLGDNSDPDKDGDGISNEQDAFPENRLEWLDSDNDGVGNNADSDNDNDTVPDIQDFYPLDARKSSVIAADFLPLTKGSQWIYDQYSAPVILGAEKEIANQKIMPIEFPHGYKTYLKVVNNQIQFFGFYFANVDVGYGPFSTDFMLDKGVNLLTTNRQSGKGKVNINPKYGKKDLTWTVDVTYMGAETLMLPSGQYNGMHTRLTFIGSTKIEGETLQLSYEVDYWFAEGVGLVQMSEYGWVMSLVRASIKEPVEEPGTPTENPSSGGGGGSVNHWMLLLLSILLIASYRRKYYL